MAFENLTPERIWVCVDCYFTHHGVREDHGDAPDREPLSLIDAGTEVTAGMLAELHSCGREHDPDYEDECECEQTTFSHSSCDGCGSHLGGAREALTLWLPIGK